MDKSEKLILYLMEKKLKFFSLRQNKTKTTFTTLMNMVCEEVAEAYK